MITITSATWAITHFTGQVEVGFILPTYETATVDFCGSICFDTQRVHVSIGDYILLEWPLLQGTMKFTRHGYYTTTPALLSDPNFTASPLDRFEPHNCSAIIDAVWSLFRPKQTNNIILSPTTPS